MNSVQLIGRIGKSPEIRYAQSGTAVCNVSLATNKKVKREDKTSWHRLVAFGKTAELIEKYVKKGDQLGVEGEISYGSYEKEGVPVYTTDIIVNRIHFISEKKEQSNQGYQQGHEYSNQNSQDSVPNPYKQEPVPDDDIPF